MSMVLTASNLPNSSCLRCRYLTTNLIKSVDAFEVLATGHDSIPAEILISTIRNIISTALTTDGAQTAQEIDSCKNATDSQPGNQENVIDIEQDEPLAAPSEHFNSPLDKKGRSRKRQGRPKGSKTKICKSNPRKSRRQSRTVTCTELSSVSEKGNNFIENDSASQRPILARNFQRNVTRPVATQDDFQRASEFLKKIKVDTPDDFFYYLHECLKCSQLFPGDLRNAQRHVVRRHFHKRVENNTREKSSKTLVQLVPDKLRKTNKAVKVRLYRKESRSAKIHPSNSNKGRSRIISISSIKSEIQKHSISLSIPPNLTVRNPCANFDLEKAVGVQVLVELTSNLTSVRGIRSGPSQSETTNGDDDKVMTQGPRPSVTEIMAEDSNIRTNEEVKAMSVLSDLVKVAGISDHVSASPVNICGENVGEKLTRKIEIDSTKQMLSDARTDLVEVDVDTIMNI